MTTPSEQSKQQFSEDLPPTGLWRDRNFVTFWIGQSLSKVGTSVNYIALPLVGVVTLELGTFEVGVLATISTIPAVVFGPFVGPIVDRLNRRRLMLVTDVVRGLLVATVPLAVLTHQLSFLLLAIVGAGMALLRPLFTVANDSYLPSIVDKRMLADGNGKLEASETFADVTGPGIAGWMMGLAGPAGALLVDAASYFASAGSLLRVDERSTSQERLDEGRSLHVNRTSAMARIWRETVDGFALLRRDPLLFRVSIANAFLVLSSNVQMAVYIVFLVREQAFGATTIGVVYSVGGAISFVAALGAARLADHLGTWRLTQLGLGVQVAGGVLLASVGGQRWQAVGIMLAGETCFGVGMSLFGVGSRTLYQTRTTDSVRGRVIGAAAALRGLLVASSGIVGGAVGVAFGLRAALIVGALGMILSLAWLVLRGDWNGYNTSTIEADPQALR